MAIRPLADAELSEAQFAKLIFSTSARNPGLAHMLGFKLVYHTYRPLKSAAGFPDYVLARERVIFAELKTEKGKPSEFQREWLGGLRAAGAEAYLWRPSDFSEG